MKTTINIADDLLLRVKELARRESRTLKAVVEEALRWILKQRSEKPPASRPFKIKTMSGSGLTDEARRLGWAKILELANERDAV